MVRRKSSDSFPRVLLWRTEKADIKGLEWVCRMRRKVNAIELRRWASHHCGCSMKSKISILQRSVCDSLAMPTVWSHYPRTWSHIMERDDKDRTAKGKRPIPIGCLLCQSPNPHQNLERDQKIKQHWSPGDPAFECASNIPLLILLSWEHKRTLVMSLSSRF